jgi:hypothetical protein
MAVILVKAISLDPNPHHGFNKKKPTKERLHLKNLTEKKVASSRRFPPRKTQAFPLKGPQRRLTFS